MPVRSSDNENKYYLVKVTKREYADKLLDGDVYMSPLSSFGDLLTRPEHSKNIFRGDTAEGLSQSFSRGNESAFFGDSLGEKAPMIAGAGQIAECFLQERLYSLYCLEYSDRNSSFISPARDLVEFGDTAVIIFDPWQFLYRVCTRVLLERGDSVWIGAKRVRYEQNLAELAQYDEFSKSPAYSWQNEFRIAVDLSEGKADREAWDNMTDFCRIMFLNQVGKVDLNAKRKPLTIKIGDIRDIATHVPTTDLVELRLPLAKLLAPPVAPKPIEPPRRPVVTTYRPVIKWD